MSIGFHNSPELSGCLHDIYIALFREVPHKSPLPCGDIVDTQKDNGDKHDHNKIEDEAGKKSGESNADYFWAYHKISLYMDCSVYFMMVKLNRLI